jgi:TadE-like protein
MLAFTQLIQQIAPCVRRLARRIRAQEGAELIEFAISLPLLVVFVVGIYDFGSAFTLKQKLGNITLEAARIAASQPMNDLSNPVKCGSSNVPGSICTIRNIAASDLAQNHVINCDLSPASVSSPPSSLDWIFTVSSGCKLEINRGLVIPGVALQSPFTSNYMIEATQVKLTYPYQWQFNRVIGFLAPGANFTGGNITSQAVMQNLN